MPRHAATHARLSRTRRKTPKRAAGGAFPLKRRRSAAVSCVCPCFCTPPTVAFKIYDVDKDGFISNGELFQVLKLMVGNNLKDTQLQQIVDKTIIYADKDGDGKVSFDEFVSVWQQVACLRLCILSVATGLRWRPLW